ncbi:MFS transporter [Marinosulfonomonas sp. PRT-SC04]|nr:MFS transporter [Marinosulfonomonas sp. PRT-SC04]
MPTIKTPPHITTLIALTAFSTLSLNMFLPSLASIADDLDADYGTVSLSVAGYLAVTAVVQLIVGPLSDRVGRRPVLLGALAMFTCASVACALAQDVWTFLVFRMLQGGIISGYALSMAIVRDTKSEREAAGLIGYISMAMAIAPMLGPMLGGVLDTAFGWRANFYFYAVSGAFLLVLCWIDLGETKPARSSESNSGSDTAIALLREPLFWAYSLCSAFSTGAFYIFLTGAPLVAKTEFGASTAELGFFIGTITAGFMVGGFIAGRFAPRFASTTMMLAGRLVACTGLLIGFTVLAAGWLSPMVFFGSTIFVGLGNGLTMPSCNAGAMSVRPNLAGTAAGLNGALIVAGGAVLTTATGLALPEEGAALVLLALMLSASSASLLAALWAKKLNNKET